MNAYGFKGQDNIFLWQGFSQELIIALLIYICTLCGGPFKGCLWSLMMLIICSKNKKAIVCGKQNTGLKMREELIVRFLSSGLAHEQKHTDTSHCCWQPVQVHSLLSWSWQKREECWWECRNVSNAKSQRYLTSDICQGTCFALMRPWFHIFQPSKERRFYSIIPDN